MFKYLCLPLFALLMACAGNRTYGGSPNIDFRAEALPAPTIGDLAQDDPLYVIGAYDLLTINVLGVEGLSDKEVRVDGSGMISFPIAGSIKASGQTPEQLQALLRERLRAAYIRDPLVSVNLKEGKSRLVTVSGEVREPGMYPVVPDMTLMRAIASARGTGEFASKSHVVVFREVGGQKLAALYNVGAIERGIYDDPRIYPDDVVVVDDNAARRLFRDFLSLLPTLTTPIVVALQQ